MKYITRQFIKNNPDTLFIFGDNLERLGFGGQAKECRGESNTYGIATKKKASHTEDAYFSDDEINLNRDCLNSDFGRLIFGIILNDYVKANSGSQYNRKYKKLYILPLGIGLAEMPKRCPVTYNHLKECVEFLKRCAIYFDLEIWE